jgi:hypothetical protein
VIYFKDWRSANKYWSLEATLRLSVFEPGGKISEIKISGWALNYHGDLYALYRNEGALNFFANGKIFKPANSGLVLAYFRIVGCEVFIIRHGLRMLYSRFYNSLKQVADKLNDPSFDGIDEDNVFFLKYCTKMLGSSKRRDGLLKQWENWNVQIPQI